MLLVQRGGGGSLPLLQRTAGSEQLGEFPEGHTQKAMELGYPPRF